MSQQVTRSQKDSSGDIIGLCGVGWSHNKATAVSNIRRDTWAYYVSVNGRSVYVRVGSRNGQNYLTTAPDNYSPNNLSDLPDC